MAVEPLRVIQATIALLRNDAELLALFQSVGKTKVQAYADLAPREVDPVYIVMMMQGSDDTNVIDGERAFTNPTVQIVCVGKEGGYEEIGPFADRVDDLVRNNDGNVVDGVYIARMVRSAVMPYIDDIDNTRYYQIAQVYSNIAYAYTP